jgi:hypothetical protein
MWMINPALLCNQHLLGEHGEIHKHRHNFIKHHSITGRIYPVILIEPASMQERHDQLANEMLRRGFNHKSPYEQPDLSHLTDDERYAKVNVKYNLADLSNRCAKCAERIKGE